MNVENEILRITEKKNGTETYRESKHGFHNVILETGTTWDIQCLF